jgi:hypothetical protein
MLTYAKLTHDQKAKLVEFYNFMDAENENGKHRYAVVKNTLRRDGEIIADVQVCSECEYTYPIGASGQFNGGLEHCCNCGEIL